MSVVVLYCQLIVCSCSAEFSVRSLFSRTLFSTLVLLRICLALDFDGINTNSQLMYRLVSDWGWPGHISQLKNPWSYSSTTWPRILCSTPGVKNKPPPLSRAIFKMASVSQNSSWRGKGRILSVSFLYFRNHGAACRRSVLGHSFGTLEKLLIFEATRIRKVLRLQGVNSRRLARCWRF